MPYSLVLERASGTHNYSVQRKVEPTHLRVLCSVPVSQAHSNKFRFAALEALCFISLWCLGAQRKGMVIIMTYSEYFPLAEMLDKIIANQNRIAALARVVESANSCAAKDEDAMQTTLDLLATLIEENASRTEDFQKKLFGFYKSK